MQSVILVGGEGTRLRPLTYQTPKQMLPLVGVPMIECVMEKLARHGVTDAVLSLGYLPDQLHRGLPGQRDRGRAGDLRRRARAARHRGRHPLRARSTPALDDTFLVVNGDVLTDLDITRLLAFHREHGAEATIALHPVEDPSRFGVVPTTPDGRVMAFVEKPPRDEAPTNLINAGTYIIEPRVLDRIAPTGRVSVERETFPRPRRGRTLLRDGRRRLLARHRNAPDLPARQRRHPGRAATGASGAATCGRLVAPRLERDVDPCATLTSARS